MNSPRQNDNLLHRRWLRLGAIGVTLFAMSCASYTQETQNIRSNYFDGSYAVALKKLNESSLGSEDKNKLLYRLEKAMILDRMGDYAKSRSLLLEADKIADDLYTTSITRTAASFIVSESSTDYSGENYEKVAIHTELALSYLATRDLDAARVEARKINNKLAQINGGYEDHKDRYGEDAFARYLSGMIYEARGEIDDAIIDYTKALALYNGSFAQFVHGGPPDSLVVALYRLLAIRNRTDRMQQLQSQFPKLIARAKQDLQQDDSGEVIVIHELGHIAVKTSQEFILPFDRQVIRFSFPVIHVGYRSYFGQSGITDQSSQRFVSADNTADLNAIAQASLEDRRGRLIAKGAARLLAKGQLVDQAYRNFGPLAGIAANIFTAVTETADTRGWTLLPEAFAVSRIRLKPGKHTIKLQSGGRLSRIEEINLKKGEILLFRDVG